MKKANCITSWWKFSYFFTAFSSMFTAVFYLLRLHKLSLKITELLTFQLPKHIFFCRSNSSFYTPASGQRWYIDKSYGTSRNEGRKPFMHVTNMIFCVPNWLGRINNATKHSYRKHSEESLYAIQIDLPNQVSNFEVFGKVNVEVGFEILNTLMEKSLF